MLLYKCCSIQSPLCVCIKMASNIDDESNSIASTISANVPQGINEGRDTNNRHASCRRKLLFIARLLLILLCLAYNSYLLWLLAYLKDSRNYWLLSLYVIPVSLAMLPSVSVYFSTNVSLCVTFTVIICFTMLSRLAYYHRHQDDFIGPQFVMASLKGSIILILLDIFLARDCKMELLLKDKDMLSRALFDFSLLTYSIWRKLNVVDSVLFCLKKVPQRWQFKASVCCPFG